MSFREDRFGFVLILSSLAVIALISGIHVWSQLDARRSQNRAQGVSLARLLSSNELVQLVPERGRQGLLDLVKATQINPDFAYGAIADAGGSVLLEVSAPGVMVPAAPLPEAPADWIGERVLPAATGGRSIREFIAPVIANGERVAHVRIGFVEPGLASYAGEASLLGMMALPIFLLTPLAYFLIRRGVRPLVTACAELNDLVQAQRFDTVQIEATGEVGEFIRGFNRFMALAKTRIEDLEKERTSIVASSKIVAYQKSRIEAVLASLPDATMIIDETGSVVFANPRLEPMLGITSELVVGHKPSEWCTHPDLLAILESCRLQGGQATRSGEIEVTTGDGATRNVFVSTRPLSASDESSQVVGTLVVLHDVTTEATERRSQGEFVAQMAHELKAPLHVMAMYGESLIGEEGSRSEFRVETSNVIRDEVERLAGLINTLLSIARIEAGAVAIQRERVRLREFLEDAVDVASRSVRGQQVGFLVDVPKDASPIFVEKELMRVAVNNLLTNAIKYNREGGEVSIFVEESETRTTIRVRDTGVGIREQDLPNVFDKFYRSEDEQIRKRPGHGLGLSLAREIVELHGGSIRVESAVGEGSEFSIVLRKRADGGGTGA
jgi:PAS domain S-box-containing protein